VYTTDHLPQANRFPLVMTVVDAVAAGARTHEEVAAAVGGYRKRQGAYYRKAAELLGLVSLESPDHIVLTPAGRRFVAMTPAEKHLHITRQLVRLGLIGKIVDELKAKPQGLTREEIHGLVATLVPGTTPKMIQRRTSTILSWLKYFGLISERQGQVRLTSLPLDFAMWEVESGVQQAVCNHQKSRPQPRLLKGLNAMHKPDPVPTGRDGPSVYVVDAAKVERAECAHERLVRSMALHLLSQNLLPRRNAYIDLYTRSDAEEWLFEMKSCTPQNIHSQVRSGLAQLYEYRYLQRMRPTAHLILVLETQPPPDSAWLVDYLVRDREIAVIWATPDNGFAYPDTCAYMVRGLRL